jgi:hypothetical protein
MFLLFLVVLHLTALSEMNENGHIELVTRAHYTEEESGCGLLLNTVLPSSNAMLQVLLWDNNFSHSPGDKALNGYLS